MLLVVIGQKIEQLCVFMNRWLVISQWTIFKSVSPKLSLHWQFSATEKKTETKQKFNCSDKLLNHVNTIE